MRHVCRETPLVEPCAGFAAKVLHEVIAIALSDTGMLARSLHIAGRYLLERICI